MSNLILVINPGSVSTKVSLYRDERSIYYKEISHSQAELSVYPNIMDQIEFRETVIRDCIKDSNYNIDQISCVIARGGALRPILSGTYRVNSGMLADLRSCIYGAHASNLGAILAKSIADAANVKAYIVDPITVSEMDEVATVSGIPDIKRESIFHALNQKAVARQAAEDLGKKYENCRFIVVHMGGGISVGVHSRGRVIDVNNALNGDGPLAPTRSGNIPEWSLVKLALSGKYSKDEFKHKIMTNGGVSAYLGTSDLKEVKRLVIMGDAKARLIYGAMVYQIAKEIGSCATVLEGRVDAIVLTGGMARDEDFVNLIKKRTSFIARIMLYPGNAEMRALAMGALRVLNGQEKVREY
jgi:butyrate kinase